MRYNWQKRDWPEFRFDPTKLDGKLLAFAEHSGRTDGLLEGLPLGLETEAILDLMIAEALKTSAIEGEVLEREDVMSSIRNHLGLNSPLQPVKNRLASGAGELMVAVRSNFQEPLTEEMLFAWHKMLLGESGHMTVGGWRTGSEPMQVISGRFDKSTIHFEAPPAVNVPTEMKHFITWFNSSAEDESIHQPAVRSAIAHLYFESIHPFEDGNGRIGRALSEKALSQGLGRPVFLSLSRTIEANRSAYYDALKAAQSGNEITGWLEYFVDTVLHAQLEAESQIMFILKKSKFFQKFDKLLNQRQSKVIRRMFDSGSDGFKGGMNAKKYQAMTKASKATATRDLQNLAKSEVLHIVGDGRSTRYELNLE